MGNQVLNTTVTAWCNRQLPWLGAVLLLSLLAACERETETRAPQRPPVAFHPGDECHVCGMLIARYPGPRGQAYVRRRDQPLKFCSTRDLFAWLLQPETAAVVEEVYVHDMAQTDWAHPQDTRLIDARSAWYVIGSERRGAMGPTLVSFADRAAALSFADQHGGRLMRFADITLPVLESLMPAADPLNKQELPR